MFRFFAILLLALAAPANAATFSVTGDFVIFEDRFGGVRSNVFVPFSVEVELTPTTPFSPFFQGSSFITKGNCVLSADVCSGRLDYVTRPDGSLLLYSFFQVGPKEFTYATPGGLGFTAQFRPGRFQYLSGNPVYLLNGSVPLASAPEPGLWAMLIIGFGGIGARMRRRAKSLSAGLLAKVAA